MIIPYISWFRQN